MSPTRVVVVGGGIFGVTIAVKLAREGYQVDLCERNGDILMGASGINQYRLHRGYHYPRSRETALAAKKSEASFCREYGAAVVDSHSSYYAISRRDSLTSPGDYIGFCDELELEYDFESPDIIRSDALDLCVRVSERLFDPDALRALCWVNLEGAGVKVRLDTLAGPETLESYDFAVIATYAVLNELVSVAPEERRRYQFEVVEKPVVRLPRDYQGKSVVVMDGPFMCVDPLGRGETFVMGNVVHAIHHANVGISPEVPDELRPLLNRGIVQDPPVTRFRHFLDSANEFFTGIYRAEHVGSMFTIRTVLPEMDDTDARPTVVNRVDDRIITIYSGKVGTCVDAADQVLAMLRGAASISEAAGPLREHREITP